MQLFERSGAFFMQNCYSNLHILNFFRTRFWFQEGSFGPEMLIYLRSFAFRMLFFFGICSVFEQLIILMISLSSLMTPAPRGPIASGEG